MVEENDVNLDEENQEVEAGAEEVQPEDGASSEKGSTFDSLVKLIKTAWQRRESGLELPAEVAMNMPVTHEQVLYLLSMYPFLQIVSTSAENFYEEGAKLIKLKNNWVLHDYGDAMSVSLGDLLFTSNHLADISLEMTAGENMRKSGAGKTVEASVNQSQKEAGGKDGGGDEGGGAGAQEFKFPEGQGTVVNQTVNVAEEMIRLAKEKNWPGINIIAGTDLMKWAAWMTAQDLDLSVEGFTPGEQGLAKRLRVKAKPIPPLRKPVIAPNARK
jgi:hypothetical protein